MQDLRVLLREPLVELFHFVEQNCQFVNWRQNGHSEVICALSLSKATSWHQTNASLLQHLHAVKHVRLLAFLQGLFNGLVRDGYARERVHGSLDWITSDPWHSVQDLLRQFGLLCQGT